ncbi:unnamed protein product [Rhizophagus irregularis]|nr:unnamed protein product [Rhizophagus irregularis]
MIFGTSNFRIQPCTVSRISTRNSYIDPRHEEYYLNSEMGLLSKYRADLSALPLLPCHKELPVNGVNRRFIDAFDKKKIAHFFPNGIDEIA